MRLERLIAEETYRPAAVGTTLVANRPGAADHTVARGNPALPLQNSSGEGWLQIDRGKPDGMKHPAPDW